MYTELRFYFSDRDNKNHCMIIHKYEYVDTLNMPHSLCKEHYLGGEIKHWKLRKQRPSKDRCKKCFRKLLSL